MGRSRFQLRQLDTPRRGQATVELVILALFVLIPLLAGIGDITRAYFEHLAVVHAANVSARWATLSSSEQYCSGYGSVEQVVADDLSNVPVQIKAVTTTVVQGAPGNTVQVTVTYSHTLLFGVTDTQLVFKGSSTMPGTVATPAACPNC